MIPTKSTRDRQKPLTGVTVGCGFFSRIQMEAWPRVSGARMVAACDLDRPTVEKFSADFNLRPYSNLDEMLDTEKPDFVDIVTRPASHGALVEQTAARGLNTLLQKPVAETWEESVRIVETARAGAIRMMINENWRWQAWYRKIAELISAGDIGSPFRYRMDLRQRDGLGENPYPNQPYFAEMPRLLVFETLVHHLDTARFLFGDIEELYCRTSKLNPRIAGEDAAFITVEHRGGVAGVIDGSRAAEPREPGEVMGGSRIEGSAAVLTLKGNGDVFRDSEQIFWGEGLGGYKGDSCRAAQQHFVDCLATGAEFESEAGDYVQNTFAAVEACYRSAADNRPVALPLDGS